MGWKAVTREGEFLTEECHHIDCPEPTQHTDFCVHPICPDNNLHSRPVERGNNNELLCIAQEDFGYKVLVDLKNGVIILGYAEVRYQNGTLEIIQPGHILWICEETNIVGDYKHLKQELVYERDAEGKRVLVDGKYNKVRNDILTDLIWRPIWFTRTTNGVPTKVIGAQTTTPKLQGEKNVKKLVSLFADGRLGID